MCGRFSLILGPEALQVAFPGFEIPADLRPRYNIAPTQSIAAIANTDARRVEFFRWGLVPPWATDLTIGNRMINARAETLAEKPAFRAAYRQRRCLILADGFYEWRAESGTRTKTPYRFTLASEEPFAFAGLWEVWRLPTGEPVTSCTIITTEPNALVLPIHNRMPVILPPAAYALWLTPTAISPEQLQPWLKPYAAEQMTMQPVDNLKPDQYH